ncbi:hypothetical protein, partial [Lacticaseibacillus paracasei]|uniref:hypothetical protein n=1 Tax=Lacticaseibacillus paracasei TaxID=1597 RepID=UPI001CDC2F64|nr:hypothetical protein [Lacticaseibacillus casei]
SLLSCLAGQGAFFIQLNCLLRFYYTPYLTQKLEGKPLYIGVLLQHYINIRYNADTVKFTKSIVISIIN